VKATYVKDLALRKYVLVKGESSDPRVITLDKLMEKGAGVDVADFEARANVFAVVVGIFWKPADFLMIAGGFSPGDVIAGGFGFVQEWNRNLFDCAATLPEHP